MEFKIGQAVKYKSKLYKITCITRYKDFDCVHLVDFQNSNSIVTDINNIQVANFQDSAVTSATA